MKKINKSAVKKLPKAQKGGSYIATSKTLMRNTVNKDSTDIYDVTRMDTTGYAKGKPTYDVKRDFDGTRTTKKISRKEVPSEIDKLKKGASQKIDLRTGKNKTPLKNGGKISTKMSKKK